MGRLRILFAFLVVVAACGGSADGGSTAERVVDAGGVTSVASSPGESAGPVTEAGLLEELRSRCAAGDVTMCDILFQASDFGSELESFGDTCGGQAASSGEYCADQFGVPYELGSLRDDCGGGDMVACDLLYLYAAPGSVDEAFGDACGGLGEGTNRTCVVSWGFVVDVG